ncbi:uncharacterized protein LOC123671046 [Harmonia axyridis]|uniref:uncharacterized protein LOC123671046 n=1 Tax=Harmonia axyridis TaxID=115357 RepID=UPI001E277343|nr:uncharacterized protein LOC123671046 [Harmonia axyridis]
MSLPIEDWSKIVVLIENELSQRSVARRMNVSLSAVQRLLTRHQEESRLARRPGSGRRRCKSLKNDRFMVTLNLGSDDVGTSWLKKEEIGKFKERPMSNSGCRQAVKEEESKLE